MSPKNPSILAGLAAPGLLWLATSVALGQTAPAPPGPPTPAPTSTSPTTYRVLLLSSGKVVQGEISQDADTGTYRLRANGGPVSYPRTMVLKAAGSIEELYQFQVARLPVGDVEERMKLAKWCLTSHLYAHAKEQLETINKMSPGEADVERMLYNIASSKADRPNVDPGVRRTSGETTQDDAPRGLDPRIMSKVQRRFNALPQIFDLTQAQAIVRANEFANSVQIVVLRNCVKCHDERYDGSFQLVGIKIQRDLLNPDIARANLDATLRLVNPDDPPRSELLSAGLVPHGGSKNSIFRGPNDAQYKILLTWVKSLRPAPPGSKNPGDPGSRPGFSTPESTPGDGFAADRSGRASGAASYPSASFPAGYKPALPQLPGVEFAQRAAASAAAPPSHAVVEKYEENATFLTAPGDNPQFPAPLSIEGMTPTPVPSSKPRPGTAKAVPNSTSPAAAQVPSKPMGAVNTAKPNGPKSVAVGPTDNPNLLPGMNQPLYPNSPKADPDADDEAGKVDPANRQPKKIDNALLERLMKNRNGAP
jgi:hypothetical protein